MKQTEWWSHLFICFMWSIIGMESLEMMFDTGSIAYATILCLCVMVGCSQAVVITRTMTEA